jgi:hypothetical protein
MKRALAVFLVLTALLITWSTVEPMIRQPGFVAYCEDGHVPSIWLAGPPRWATRERMDLLCAFGAWARAEFHIAVEEER